MATANQTETELDLRKEFDALRKLVGDLLTEVRDTSKEKSAHLADKLESELGRYEEKAGQKLKDVYEAGNAGLDEVSGHIRRNPVTSLLVAFGVGYVLSRLLGPDK